MGRTTNVECEACGYADMIVVGGGMRTMHADNLWPVACKQCKRIVSSKINQTPVVCEACASADVTPLGRIAPLFGPVIDEMSWDERVAATAKEKIRCYDRVLEDVKYVCPRCGALELRAATRPGLMFD